MLRSLQRLGKRRQTIAIIKYIEDKSHRKTLSKPLRLIIPLIVEIEEGLGIVLFLSTFALMAGISKEAQKMTLD